MTEKEIDALINESIEKMDKEAAEDKELEEMALKFAKKLIDRGHMTEYFLNSRYKWWFEVSNIVDPDTNKTEKGFSIYCLNLTKAELVFPQSILKPAIANIAFNETRDDKLSCLATGIYALFRHIMGKDIIMEAN